MNGRAHWIPRLITATAILHIAFGFAVAASTWREIVAAGVVNAIGNDVARNEALWFVMTGFAWLALGDVARWGLRETGRIPANLGGWLLASGVPIVVLMPASGGWLVVAIGVLALGARGDEKSPAPQPGTALPAATRT